MIPLPPLCGLFLEAPYCRNQDQVPVPAAAWTGIEVVIAALLIGPERWRKPAFQMDVLLHGAIIATIGLWSFSLIMIGAAAVAATPDRVELADPVPQDGRKTSVAEEPKDLNVTAEADEADEAGGTGEAGKASAAGRESTYTPHLG
ncbi:hypothetical protein ACWGH2_01645 [Streptomyces sp. NPDC054871]